MRIPDVQVAHRVNSQPVQYLVKRELRAGGGSAVAGEAVTAIAGHRGDDPVRGDLANAGISCVKDVEIARLSTARPLTTLSGGLVAGPPSPDWVSGTLPV